MGFSWWTFVLQTVNFAVLVWLLHRYLYRPVLSIIAARRNDVEKQYEQVAAAKAEASAQTAALAAERLRIAGERDASLKAAAAQAEDLNSARRARAEREATALVEASRKTIAEERAAAIAQARLIAIDLGCDIARRLLDEMPVKLRAEAWLERFEQYLAALPSSDREGLRHQVSSGFALRVVTAATLPTESADAWRNRIQQVLGDGIAVEFASDPALIDGVELHFPNSVLRFSWQSTLAALRSEVTRRTDVEEEVMAPSNTTHANTH